MPMPFGGFGASDACDGCPLDTWTSSVGLQAAQSSLINTHSAPLDVKSGLGTESQVEKVNNLPEEHSRGGTQKTDASTEVRA